MPRDRTKRNAYQTQWVKENCTRFAVKVQNNSGIPDAMERVKQSGKTANGYIVEALRKELIRDGYLASDAWKFAEKNEL